MGFSQWIGKAYDAIRPNKRRRVVRRDSRSEDKMLLPIDRDQLVANSRNLRRNSSIAAWAIRKHLDSVSTFTFQCRTSNDDFNREIENLIEWWCRPLNCDVSARFSLQELIRMLEGLATTDGDSFIYKISDGTNGLLQIIEGDRVRTPTDLGDFSRDQINPEDFTHGVQLTPAGKAVQYAICERTGGFNGGGNNGYRLKELADAQHLLMRAYRDRNDQYRGISPLASAINTLSDLYEAREYALAKMKLAQLFALKYTHGAVEGDDGSDFKFAFGEGPQIMELEDGEDAEFMESNQPSTEFQAFMMTGIQEALKALDIPFSAFDESHTNYSGARVSLSQYRQSAEIKRDALRQILNALTVWRLQIFIANGDLVLPPEIKTIDDIKFEWIGTGGVAFIDPLKEVTASILAAKSGITSRQRICKENGEDFFVICDELAAEANYMTKKGLSPDIENITQVTINEKDDSNADSK